MRSITIIANWKMNLSLQESIALADVVEQRVRTLPERMTVILCPPFTALPSVHALIRVSMLGAQDVFWEQRGAFTGEISPRMLVDIGCRAVILGHSERREYLGETNAMVQKKIRAALDVGLVPVVCVGETRAERDAGRKEQVVGEQVVDAFRGVTIGQGIHGKHGGGNTTVYIAYEPVWAIGSGSAVAAADAAQMHEVILHALREVFPQEVIDATFRVLYGGSVDQRNIVEFLRQPHISGCLVGGASQRAKEFLGILEAAATL